MIGLGQNRIKGTLNVTRDIDGGTREVSAAHSHRPTAGRRGLSGAPGDTPFAPSAQAQAGAKTQYARTASPRPDGIMGELDLNRSELRGCPRNSEDLQEMCPIDKKR